MSCPTIRHMSHRNRQNRDAATSDRLARDMLRLTEEQGVATEAELIACGHSAGDVRRLGGRARAIAAKLAGAAGNRPRAA